MTSTTNYTQQDPDDSASDFAARQFQINQTLARVRTMVLVQVKAIGGGAGAIASPGTVNVQPLVKIIDGAGNVTSHGTINNIPVFRLGGGTNAIICDPVVGDIGWMAVADRDSSVVKSTKAEAQPGSRRTFDLADGVYMGSLLSPTPTQYVVFDSTGIKVVDSNGNTIKMEADGVNINGLIINQSGQVAGDLPVTGALKLSGSIDAIDGTEYTGNILTTGTISGSDMIANPGAAQVTLRGHISTASTNPPTPGH